MIYCMPICKNNSLNNLINKVDIKHISARAQISAGGNSDPKLISARALTRATMVS